MSPTYLPVASISPSDCMATFVRNVTYPVLSHSNSETAPTQQAESDSDGRVLPACGTYLPGSKQCGTCYTLVQGKLPTLRAVPFGQFRGRGLLGCVVALHIICGVLHRTYLPACLEGVGHVLHTCARQAANTEGCALWSVQGPRSSRMRSGFTHNMRCARHVNERFTVTPCSEKFVINTNDVSPRQRAFHSNTV